MTEVTLLFSGDVSSEEVYEVFGDESNGLSILAEVEDLPERSPLHAGAELIVGIVGAVLGAGQLAAAIWQLRTTPGRGRVTVEVAYKDGSRMVVSGDSAEEVEEALRRLTDGPASA